MTDDELEALVERLEGGVRRVAQAALDDVSVQFSQSVEEATELIAAAFSVSSIRRMWNRRIPGIMTALQRVFHRGGDATAEGIPAPAPSDAALRDAVAAYGDAVAPLLRTVGDHLAQAAQETLADGVNNGETLDQLKARLIAVFDETGSQLGPVRAQRIAMTETTRAFNAGALAAAQVISERDGVPVVKQWLTRRDDRVREAHADTNGQLQLLPDPFDVDGVDMQYPGDPTAPADLTINCRCLMKATAGTPERTASMAEDGNGSTEDLQSRMPPQLKRYWLLGEGAAKIRWGTPGSFERCVRNLRDDFPQDTEGLCANLYHEATGKWPGADNASEHTSAMIALVPTEADAARLALSEEGSEAADQLHLTLFYLGEAADWSEASQADLVRRMRIHAESLRPVAARVFGVAAWNPHSEEPAFVWNVGNERESDDPTVSYGLEAARAAAVWALEDGHDDPQLPEQYAPWSPHVCAAYGQADISAMAERCGPVTFDRIRVAFAGQNVDIPLGSAVPDDDVEPAMADSSFPAVAGWSTPGQAALAFENRQTGDGRIFTPGALYWDGNGPWPLMANENFDSHDDASLAGAIASMYRDGDRLGADGLLYLTRYAGSEAALLLAQGAPLGVSVDLDDVDVEMVDVNGGEGTFRTRLLRASVLAIEGGGYQVKGETVPIMTAGANSMVLTSKHFSVFVGEDGRVPAGAFAADVVAAAGDPDLGGVVVDTQRSGDYLMRITRGRVRGATLVNVPAFAGARIVLDNPEMFASSTADDVTAALKTDSDYERVLRHVRRSKSPVGAARVAQYLKIPVMAARRHLANASDRGEVVRLTRGLYTDATTSAKADHVMMDDMLAAGGDLVASVTGAVDLPVADRARTWDGAAAATRVFEWADGDADRIAEAFAYRDDQADPLTKRAYKLGYADVIDGTLTIVPKGVFAAEGALNGSRGGVDIPQDEVAGVRSRLAEVRAHVDEVTGGENMDEMQSSAWAALADLPAMPAEWFREPTAEELPPGGAGVNYSNGRIFGWVAQSNVPHAGYAKRVVINELGRIDTTEFLRQKFTLDDGTVVKAGAFTMNAGHHRDGAECETAACQFDDTRTVAGIVTVGMNERGMWFSGAAAPWLSEWDRQVFMACQPSYHLKKAANGSWKLSAVLSVPVPGHPSALLASAVVDRGQVALTAAATMAEVTAAVAAEKSRTVEASVETTLAVVEAIDYERLADSLVAAMARAEDRKAQEAAELAALLAEGRTMDADTTVTERV